MVPWGSIGIKWTGVDLIVFWVVRVAFAPTPVGVLGFHGKEAGSMIVEVAREHVAIERIKPSDLLCANVPLNGLCAHVTLAN